MGPGRAARGLLWVAGAVALVAGAVHLAREHRLDVEREHARADLEAGRHDQARGRLFRLAAARPADWSVALDLGASEWALGRPEEAVAAWSRVPPGAGADSVRATVASAQALIELGRFADAERALEAAAAEEARGLPEAATARELLAFLCRYEGRVDEIRPHLERAWRLARAHAGSPAWDSVSSPIDMIRQYATVDLEPIASDEVAARLEAARLKAPGDDRVRLGLANLATREGRLDEADRLLNECAGIRPGDAAVVRARLDWALAAGEAGAARDALAGLPADALGPDRLLELEAWFAARRGDAGAERAALQRLLALDPSRPEALGRLAELAAEAGDLAESGSLRERKAGLDATRRLYRLHYFRPKLPDQAPQLARWAEELGRWFEARAWWLLVLESRPGDPEVQANLARLREAGRRADTPSVAELRSAVARAADSAAGPDRTTADAGVTPRFRDEAEAAGLNFRYDNGASAERQLPETMGGGVALLDFDADGWLDVFCVQGRPLRDHGASAGVSDRLFRNRGDGTFEDATEAAGLGRRRGFGNGAAVGDVDNDGFPDLFVTRLDAYELYRNRGDGTFEDATESWGLGGVREWPTSAAFLDVDGDGDLDLYVCHYAVWDVEHPRPCRHPDGSPAYCPPHVLDAAQDHLFRNDGGRFVDVTEGSGIAGATGRGLGVVAADLDGDGLVDLFVANDGTADLLFRNLGGGRFEEVGLVAGVAANASGGYQAGMGVACGDLDGDGLLDLLVTNFYGESTTWFRNLGRGLFADHTGPSGLAALTRHRLGFGIVLLDADADGRRDILTANGHVDDFRPTFPYAMPAQLLAGTPDGRLVDASGRAGEVFAVHRLGRGLAAGDLDGDGRVDAVAVDLAGPLVYVRNVTEGGGHALRLILEGTASNRDAVGAVVAVVAGGRRSVAARCGGGSYQSASEPALHFGLGEADRVEAVEVAWPSGRSGRFEGLAVDAEYRIREGDPEPILIRRFDRRDPAPGRNPPDPPGP